MLTTVKYTAFGEIRSGTSTTDYQYTGQRSEIEIGLYFYVARFYDAQLARFISADTIIPEPGSIKGYDRYAYVNGNPISFNDPSGYKACDTADGSCAGGGKSGGGGGDNVGSGGNNGGGESSNESHNESGTSTNPIIGPKSTPTRVINWGSLILPTLQTPVPSPTAYFLMFSGQGGINNWLALGTSGDAGNLYYDISYQMDFSLTNDSGSWLLNANENYLIGPVSGYFSESKNYSILVFGFPNGQIQRINLGELDQNNTYRNTTIPIQLEYGYPDSAYVEFAASINETFMMKPFNGSNFRYDFFSMQWH